MKDIKGLIREHLRDNRFKILFGILIYSVVSVSISMLFQKFNLLIVGIIITSVISFIYLVKQYDYSNLVVTGKVATLNDLFKNINVTKKEVIVALVYLAWALISFLVLLLVGSIPKIAPLAIIILFLLFIISNAITSTYYFASKINPDFNYGHSAKLVMKDKSLLLSNGIKTIIILIQGAILTLLVNVFAYGPQLDVILDLSDSESTVLIQKIFGSTVSTFIQTAGIQMTIFYVIFVSSVTYGTYVFKNRRNIK